MEGFVNFFFFFLGGGRGLGVTGTIAQAVVGLKCTCLRGAIIKSRHALYFCPFISSIAEVSDYQTTFRFAGYHS